MQNFSELSISPFLKERLAAAKFVVPTAVQAATIPPAMEGKDVLATAQTGTGKTLAFLIPVMERLAQPGAPGVAALVLVPTRELAMQVAAQFNMLRGTRLAPAALVTGGLPEAPQLKAIRNGARIIIATPGRLEDFLDRKLVRLAALQVLVLDEADRMLDMGFLPAIRRIVAVLPKERQTLFFSATLEGSVAHLVKDYLRNPLRLAFGSVNKPSENVRLQAFELSADAKHQALCHLLTQEKGRCLVFSRTKRGTTKIAALLNQRGIQAAMIHGDRSQSQRTAALAGFQQGQYRVLVATDVASRGIHVQNIAHVINYDLPDLAENFIHRVGRTGRAGERGVASTFFLREERTDLFQLERTLGLKLERVTLDPSALQQPAPGKMATESRPKQLPSRSEGGRTSRLRGRAERRSQSRAQSQLTQLPGEFFQAQL